MFREKIEKYMTNTVMIIILSVIYSSFCTVFLVPYLPGNWVYLWIAHGIVSLILILFIIWLMK